MASIPEHSSQEKTPERVTEFHPFAFLTTPQCPPSLISKATAQSSTVKGTQAETKKAQEATEGTQRVVKEVQVAVSGKRDQGRIFSDIAATLSESHPETQVGHSLCQERSSSTEERRIAEIVTLDEESREEQESEDEDSKEGLLSLSSFFLEMKEKNFRIE